MMSSHELWELCSPLLEPDIALQQFNARYGYWLSSNAAVLKERAYQFLIYAIQRKNFYLADLLIDQDFPLDLDPPMRYDPSPLHIACADGNKYLIQALVEKGADLNIHLRPEAKFYPRANGEQNCRKKILIHGSAVQTVLQHDDPHLIDIVAPGFNAKKNFGMTLAHFACKEGALKCLKHILTRKLAGVNVKDDFGRTPLFYGAEQDMDCLQILLQHGADISMYVVDTVLHKCIPAMKHFRYWDESSARQMEPRDLEKTKDVLSMLLSAPETIEPTKTIVKIARQVVQLSIVVKRNNKARQVVQDIIRILFLQACPLPYEFFIYWGKIGTYLDIHWSIIDLVLSVSGQKAYTHSIDNLKVAKDLVDNVPPAICQFLDTKSARPLAELCRLRILSRLPLPRRRHIEELPLPHILKSYVALDIVVTKRII